MSATWKGRVCPPEGGHQRVVLFVSTAPDHWAQAGIVTARVGDEGDALLRCLNMPLEHPDRTPYATTPEENPS